MTDRPRILLCADGLDLSPAARSVLEKHGEVRDISLAGADPELRGDDCCDILCLGEAAANENEALLRRVREETHVTVLLLVPDRATIPEMVGRFDETAALDDSADLDLRLGLLLSFRSCWIRARELDLQPEELREEFAKYGLDSGLVGPLGMSTPTRVSIHHLVDVAAVTEQQMSICRLMGTAYGTFAWSPGPRGIPDADGNPVSPTSVLSPYCAYLSSHGDRCLNSEFSGSRQALLEGRAVETTCAGGIRLYSVPIVLSFGGAKYPLYATTVAVGDVPGSEEVARIAAAYGVHPEILAQMGEESRFWILNQDKADEIRATITNLAETVSREVSHKYGTGFQLFRSLLTEREIRRSEHLLAESHDALSRTNRQLTLKNEEIYEITHAITHDLRKPLVAMKSAITMLWKGYLGELDDKQFEAIDTAHEATNYMQALINDLLEAARLETGRKHLEFQDVPLEPLLERIRKRLQFQLEEQGIELSIVDLPESLVCDEASIEKVLMNLIGNAMNYIGDGEKTVTVSGIRENGAHQITVQDTGMGIPEDSMDSIFEKFQRGANVAGIRGTGLGLPIVKGIVEAHGGEVILDSEVGRGTRITFRIPVRECVEQTFG